MREKGTFSRWFLLGDDNTYILSGPPPDFFPALGPFFICFFLTKKKEKKRNSQNWTLHSAHKMSSHTYERRVCETFFFYYTILFFFNSSIRHLNNLRGRSNIFRFLHSWIVTFNITHGQTKLQEYFMVYLQGHANFNEFWVTYISKLQSILFYFYNFGQLLTILCKLHSIFTKFNQFQIFN